MRPFEALAHVRGRQALPDDVGEVRRDVVERRRADERLVRRRQHRQARSEAGAEDADRLVALLRSQAIARRASSTACRQTCAVRPTLALTM